jgi:hypothetical protein
MKIAMINGSPKLGNSNSGFLLNELEKKLGTRHEIIHYSSSNPLTDEQYIGLCSIDSLIMAFPLYDDGIPSNLFKMLVTLEEYMKNNRKKEIYVYIMVNNGFYEGQQNHIAFEIIKNWCIRCGLHFGQGIGQGAGEMIDFVKNVPLGFGPLKNMGRALQIFADNIHSHSTDEPILTSPNFPRFGWRFVATHFFWNTNAKKNGLNKKDIIRKL